MAAKSAVIYFHVQNGSGTEANAEDKGNESLYSSSNAECFTVIIIIITLQFHDRSPYSKNQYQLHLCIRAVTCRTLIQSFNVSSQVNISSVSSKGNAFQQRIYLTVLRDRQFWYSGGVAEDFVTADRRKGVALGEKTEKA